MHLNWIINPNQIKFNINMIYEQFLSGLNGMYNDNDDVYNLSFIRSHDQCISNISHF